MRKSYNRNPNATPEPYGLIESNIYERPKNAKDTYFFIGGYRYDGSKLYIDSENGKVHFCKSRDATSLLSWILLKICSYQNPKDYLRFTMIEVECLCQEKKHYRYRISD